MGKTKKEKSAAILTVIDAPNMTERGLNDIVAWLRRQATFLQRHNKQLSRRFIARYLYS